MVDNQHHHGVLEDLLPQQRALRKQIPEVYKGFAELSSAAFTEGDLSRKVKELIALAIGVVEGCDGCIASHAKAAARAGATPQEAAEAIGDWLREGKSDPAAMEVVNEKVNAIFEACTFQDVTGQRIRRAIQHLQHVETMLTDIVPGGESKQRLDGVVVSAPFVPSSGTAAEANPDLLQDAIDSMFG